MKKEIIKAANKIIVPSIHLPISNHFLEALQTRSLYVSGIGEIEKELENAKVNDNVYCCIKQKDDDIYLIIIALKINDSQGLLQTAWKASRNQVLKIKNGEVGQDLKCIYNSKDDEELKLHYKHKQYTHLRTHTKSVNITDYTRDKNGIKKL